MQKKCEYCGSYFDDGLDKCPNCGATNEHMVRNAPDQPQTIGELKKWYTDHNLPPEKVTRFFIGKNIKEPKAFGIYKDDKGKFVVYKNKADGARVIRYSGYDEKYAVNELYQKLRSEIANQKEHNKANSKSASIKTNYKNVKVELNKMDKIFLAVLILAIGLFAIGIFINWKRPTNGYYNYNDKTYYYQDGTWYYNDNGWSKYKGDTSELEDNYKDYKDTDDSSDHTFESSDFYDSHTSSSSSSDWDSGSSWSSSDSWSSSSTDWSSDW